MLKKIINIDRLIRSILVIHSNKAILLREKPPNVSLFPIKNNDYREKCFQFSAARQKTTTNHSYPPFTRTHNAVLLYTYTLWTLTRMIGIRTLLALTLSRKGAKFLSGIRSPTIHKKNNKYNKYKVLLIRQLYLSYLLFSFFSGYCMIRLMTVLMSVMLTVPSPLTSRVVE